ncbi:hypothetical protein C8R43DRAFT_1129292 [Mycena crocata]|nr:hypothetical protein C8R43DRAFT_1129292 [Mycena crocata]
MVFTGLSRQEIVQAPLDLLRNRNPNARLGAFDGRVGALVFYRGEDHFITTNADYIPALSSLERPHQVFLRSDMRYGTDDPTLWPQERSARYSHFPCIPKKGSRPDLDILWWDPSPADFASGNAQTRNTGRLRFTCLTPLLDVVNALIARCETLRQTSPKDAIPLFGEMIQNILIWTEQLQSLNTVYTKMVFMLTSVQRACLELEALYLYMSTYQSRMKGYDPKLGSVTPLGSLMGAFTFDASVDKACTKHA